MYVQKWYRMKKKKKPKTSIQNAQDLTQWTRIFFQTAGVY